MAEDLPRLRTIADYQFGANAGRTLFPRAEALTVRHASSGRPQQVLAEANEQRVVSYSVDGRFTLGLAGGERLRAAIDAPRNRVVVGAESEPFVREGKNAFAKFVHRVDARIRPGDEVCVVGPDDELFGVGRAELSADAMHDFETGVAVKLREGAEM